MPQLNNLWSISLLAITYVFLGKATLTFATLPGGVTPVWPAAGVALTAILLFGYRVWPGILIGAFILHITSNGFTLPNLLGGLSIGLGNTLTTVLPVVLLSRWVKVSDLLERSGNVFLFVALMIPAPFLSATIGVTTLCLTQVAPWPAYGTIWWTWAISNLFGVLLVAPLLLAWSQPNYRLGQFSRLRWAEAVLLVSLIVGINAVAWAIQVQLEFVLIPLLVWSAFRFGHRGTTLMVVLIYMAAVLRIVSGVNQSGSTVNTALLLFQTFIGVITLMTLVLPTVIRERQRAETSLKTANQELQLLTQQLQVANDELEDRVEQRTHELRLEQERAENLLLNILPRPIAEQLKREEKSIADGFESVTVLFADIVGFTEYSSMVSPQELVSVLNQIFSAFDRLSAKYDLEKIKTIGDAYMVVGGVPEPRPDHAQAVAAMALDMLETVSHVASIAGTKTRIRIGINTGPVVAGVIGTKKFIYDLWGDTVNIASRMESMSEPNRIQITAATYACLKDHYHCEKRGSISVKGKGEMITYWLLSQQPSPLLHP
ncbi:adenylate/guanylate cyclase domain-containing protein [Leptolyngbya sp. 'hensonii']|uniref:adenylate/guanylate cyclase domain-containing protein n=1 Tax=Leptolyngbya sp. 'hensonii' TaxID=1922337 RepID=UPI000A9D3029|nr:adenylate/guanylate cyclase domain-containing protein [Leptolyngbya sp. 'hensonii']